MLIDVIVLRNAQPIDRTFTYEVPENFISRMYPGARVLVPFGAAGLIDAVVIYAPSINTIDDDIKIKKIHYAFDDGLYLTQKDLETADYIRRETLCTYSEAISLFLPAGTAVKQIKNYAINDKAFGDTVLKKNEIAILESLKNGSCSHESICPDLKEAAKTLAINRLLAMGYIELTYDYEQNVKDRTVEWIVADGDLISHLKQIPEHHHAKIKLLKYLIEQPVVKRLALQDALKISKSVIDGFVQSGVIKIVEKDDIRMPLFMKANESKRDVILNTAQKKIYDTIIHDYQNELENDFLIHGVTGSGKTEVYAELIETVIKWGKKVILVVPEISLTPQIVARFASRFGEARIALIHSKISQGERYDQWKGIRSGKYDIIIGARSAVFAPSDDVGLIIIDECHETAFRSEKRPKYHTYDVAKFRMSRVGGFVVSGSATPSIVDYHSALQGNRKLLTLEQRHNTLSVPEIQIVDMREELVQGNKSILSRQLHEAITKRLADKEQTIIFLNRKGHSTFVSCRSCGFTLACPNCDVTLTYFKGEKSVKCNYCSYETFVPKLCPKCTSKYFKYFGVGTEKVEESLKSLFPNANIARMDRTTTSKKGSIERIISDVEAEETDILIGTQMVAKGFDFKNVSLIGILSADLLLNLPQFQASERAYQLFNQVAGRAGRGAKTGEVILQTYIPDHYAINQRSYETFYNHEIRYREALKYPPFYHMVNLIFTAKTSDEAGRYAQKSYLYLTSKLLKKGLQNELEIFHANPALLKKIDNVYRWQVIIKAKPAAFDALKMALKTLEEKFLEVKTCKISMDLDASNIL